MRTIITLLFIGFIHLNLIAQNEKDIEADIKNVTVYQEGAEISRQANVELKKGETTLTFKGLSAKLNAESVQVKGNNDLMVVSVSQSIDYLNKVKISAEINQLEQAKLSIKDSLDLLDALKKVYEQEKEMILANKAIGGDDGVDVSELENAAIFFRSRLTEIEIKRKNLDKQALLLKTNYVESAKQLLELNSKSDLPTSIVKVVVAAKSSMNYSIELKYLVNDAGWEPNYDLRIADVNQAMNLFYKAKVYQNTDEDWKNVKLILSTGNPNISNYKPELPTYFLTFNNYYKPIEIDRLLAQPKNAYGGVIFGQVTDAETGEPLIGVNVMVKDTKLGTVTDINGNYQINMPVDRSALVFAYLGYVKQERPTNSSPLNVTLAEDMVILDEVVVSSYRFSSSKSAKRDKVSKVSTPKKKEHVPLAIEKRQVSTEFEIEIPYSIPSDNQPYDVTMVEYEVPTEYHYSAVPKLSDDVYLTAKIPDWTQYEMISGNANLFFQGIYQGQTYLDLKGFEDTLSVSIGRDKDIMISREIQKDFSKKKIIGTSKTELKSWEITIKNNKNSPIDLVVEDQFPISNVADIKVEQIEASGASINKDDGKLLWNLKLKPKEKKVLIVKYEVKYPKNRRLLVE